VAGAPVRGITASTRLALDHESEEPAVLQGIDTVFYQVCNMERAVAFYGDTLGLELVRREGNDWAEFNAGAINLSLSGELAVAPQKGGATVVLRTAEMDAMAARLKEAGTVVGTVEDLGGARMLDIYDPDGNQLVLLEPQED
jgi:predicted enzyme related to lactoylglutathione lyase